MFRAVPRLGRIVGGWTVHPYGPSARWRPKLYRLIAQTRANGASRRIPIDVTEYGISTDNGAALTDNYDWPVNLSYTQAASALAGAVRGMRSDPRIGRRLRLFMIYSAHDLGPSHSGSDRETYFGALRHNLRRKGAYSAQVRKVLAR